MTSQTITVIDNVSIPPAIPIPEAPHELSIDTINNETATTMHGVGITKKV